MNTKPAETSVGDLHSPSRMPTGNLPLKNLFAELDDDGVCTLTFDRPNSSANLLDAQTLSELDEHLDRLANSPSLKGVILRSAKPSIFIAGADLHSLMHAAGTDQLAVMIRMGQNVFAKLASLRVPTVAAINGACAGGGYELSLACDYRLASPDSRIGLPETQLGILPAWGGSTRLPQLIGLPSALKVILGGKLMPARQALKRGIIDAIAPAERLTDLARTRIRGGKRRHKSHLLSNNTATAESIRLAVTPLLKRKTRGHYPAHLVALDMICSGISKPTPQSLALEEAAILRLVETDACRNLVRIFFLQDRARKLDVPVPDTDSPVAQTVNQTAVVGAGVMGGAIAQWLASHNLPVLLKDVDTARVGKGMAGIAKLYEEGVRRHRYTALEARNGMDRLFPITEEAPLHKVDLVIEAAVEHMAVKKEIFRKLEVFCNPTAILATNTSALPISEIAAGLNDPGRVIGLHFFNPVGRMKLVEVVVGSKTDVHVVRAAVRFVRQIGKLPVVVRDSPGFLVNRILIPYLVEAGHLFECGAHVKRVDEAMLQFGMPMGPLRLLDEVGLDVATDVAENLSSQFSRMHVPAALARMRDAGMLGRKSGRGFYDYKYPGHRENARTGWFQKSSIARQWKPPQLQKRMVLLMLNEAARCMEEGVVAAPEDVDFGMVMGTGFAPFRGGPLRYADRIGAPALVREMDALSVAGEPRFLPCELLRSMAAKSKKFYENDP